MPNPPAAKNRITRLSQKMLKHMARLAWSDDRVFQEMKTLNVSAKGSLKTIQRYKNGTAKNSPTPQIIGLISQALGFSDEERDWVVSGEIVPAKTGLPQPGAAGSITLGLTPEDVAFIRRAVSENKQLDATTEQKLQALSREIGETREVIASFFGSLEESGGSTENWQQKLLQFGQDFRKFRAELKALDPDDADLRDLRDQALLAVDAGAIDRAKGLLSRIDMERRPAIAKAEKELINAAEVKAALAQVALLEFAYPQAAMHFREAIDFLPAKEVQKRREYREAEADAFYRQGDEKGDNAGLRETIRLCQALLLETHRDRVPLDWAMTQNSLGDALRVLGERESGTARLEEAVDAYRAALEEWTRERVPLDWAMIQNNLGNALQVLGRRESGTARLEEAVDAYRTALEERTRERVPLDWAMTQNNLGNALWALGERESGTARLEEAVDAYRAALEERTRERVPLDWAMTQNNLGSALRALGERESGTARLEEAVDAYRAALEEWTRERVPLDWATTKNNLGIALQALGKRESGTARLEEAVDAYRAALEEWTRERVPLQWATTQNNLGNALGALGQRESGTVRLEEAVDAYRAALEEQTRERVPLAWAMTQNNLGSALQVLGERESGTARLEEAVDAFHAALEILEIAQADHYLEGAKGNCVEVESLIAEHQRRAVGSATLPPSEA